MPESRASDPPVSPAFWYLEAPLYHTEDYNFSGSESGGSFMIKRTNLLNILLPKITIDVYCPVCEKETVFTPADRDIDWEPGSTYIIRNGVEYAHFKCSRRHCKKNLYFIFNIRDGIVTKIGQNPSIADLITPDLKKYSKVLTKNLISDWQRAIGLRAHGIGAGSYVYLRRIIENMVLEAFSLALKDGKIKEDTYEKSRWPERIKLLKDYLPEYLVENASVYKILSKGVHELTEAECNDYFDVVNTAIDIICQQKLTQSEEQKKIKAGEKSLQKVLKKLS